MMAIDPLERTVPPTMPVRWPVDWSAIWVGALSAVIVSLIIALIGVAIGAHRTATFRIVRWSEFDLGTLVFSVFGAFISFVIGGWVAGRIAGFFRSEASMLHGAIVWLLGVSLVLVAGSVGVEQFGPWYRSIAATRIAAAVPPADDPDAARAARNAALGGLTGLLLSLMGGVIGGWMAAGEPMSVRHHRSRQRRVAA